LAIEDRLERVVAEVAAADEPFVVLLDDDLKELERVVMTRKTFGNITALPEDDSDHRFGLGKILDLVQERLAARVGVDLTKLGR
jgi:hypothetical protein